MIDCCNWWCELWKKGVFCQQFWRISRNHSATRHTNIRHKYRRLVDSRTVVCSRRLPTSENRLRLFFTFSHKTTIPVCTALFLYYLLLYFHKISLQRMRVLNSAPAHAKSKSHKSCFVARLGKTSEYLYLLGCRFCGVNNLFRFY